MKARNYIGQINILMIVINRLCDFCHTGKRDHTLKRRHDNKINYVGC